MTTDMWLVLGTGLCLVGGYRALRNKEWFWVFVASVALLWAVPQLATI